MVSRDTSSSPNATIHNLESGAILVSRVAYLNQCRFRQLSRCMQEMYQHNSSYTCSSSQATTATITKDAYQAHKGFHSGSNRYVHMIVMITTRPRRAMCANTTCLTGYIGGAVLGRLLANKAAESKYQFTVLTRSEEKARILRGLGVVPVVGSLDDLDMLQRIASKSDVVIECVGHSCQNAT